ncbi:MAG: hypothetical protein JRJ62_01545 [Deltaproteobacteria bacterium]|nr:hypothetical protein [Deltaproteobacteria bacterium]
MGQEVLTQRMWEQFEKETVLQQKIEPDVRKYIPTKTVPYQGRLTYNELKDHSRPYWYEVGVVPEIYQSRSSYDPKTVYFYGCIEGWEIPVDQIKMAKTTGIDIVQDTARVQTRKIQIEIEDALINGKSRGQYVKIGNEMAGMWSLAGQTSSYNTVKFQTDPGVYNTVKDMVMKLHKKGYKEPFVLISDTNCWDEFFSVRTYNDTNYASMIKEKLGVKEIILSDQMPAASNHDGTLLLFKPDPTCVQLLEMQPVKGTKDPYIPSSKVEKGILEWVGGLVVKQPNSIVKHDDVDFA